MLKSVFFASITEGIWKCTCKNFFETWLKYNRHVQQSRKEISGEVSRQEIFWSEIIIIILNLFGGTTKPAICAGGISGKFWGFKYLEENILERCYTLKCNQQ